MFQNILFLDDAPYRTSEFKSNCPRADIVTTAPEAIEALQKASYDLVFLDHDLGGEIYVDSARIDTGAEVARWIIANKPKIGQIVVHSLNEEGSLLMTTTLREAGYNVQKIQFTYFESCVYVHLGSDQIPEYHGDD